MRRLGYLFNVAVLALLGVITFQVTWDDELPLAHRRTNLCDEFTVRKLFFVQMLNSADLDELAAKVRETSSDSTMWALITAGSNLDPTATQWYRSDAASGKCQAELKLQRPNEEGNTRAYVDYQVESFVPAGSSRFTTGNVLYSVSASLMGARWIKDENSTPSSITSAQPRSHGEMAPITGSTHRVNLIGDGQGYRFEPAELTIAAGDGVKFVMVSGGPHNVAFDPATLSPEAKTALTANMPEQAGELSGKMLLNPNEEYTVSFANVPAGTYDFHCTPHLAMGHRGRITVR
jgi:plastocyanin